MPPPPLCPPPPLHKTAACVDFEFVKNVSISGAYAPSQFTLLRLVCRIVRALAHLNPSQRVSGEDSCNYA